MHQVVEETNRYAEAPFDDLGNIHREPHWKNFTIVWLKAFIACAMYMELKKQPNYKTYWQWSSLFHCLVIGNIFTKTRFMQLQRCLHLINSTLYDHIGWDDLMSDKFCQTWWLVHAIQSQCKWT